MKIVINAKVGGFGLSSDAWNRWSNRSGVPIDELFYLSGCGSLRDDAHLVQIVEEMGVNANGECATLKVVEIPDGIDWYISSADDGSEEVHEVHRKWS